MTVKTRITLFIVGAGFIASLLFSIVVFIELVEQPFRLLDSVLKEEAANAVKMYIDTSETEASAPFDALSEELDYYWLEIYDQSTKKILYRTNLAKAIKLSRIRMAASLLTDLML